MDKLLHVVICYHRYIRDVQLERSVDQATLLAPMTVPFRMSFSQVFGEVLVREATSADVTISSLRGNVERIFLFASEKQRLNGTEADDFIVYYRVRITDPIDPETEQALTVNNRQTLQQREDVIRQALGGTPALAVSTNTDIKGHSAWISEVLPDDVADAVAGISAFYFYGWVLALRIERRQLTQDIAPQIRAGDRVVRDIIEQRMRLLNLQRYFLLIDRTSHPQLREFCAKLSRDYRLDDRYERLSARHASFESHIENTSSALQSQRATLLSKLIIILTVLSVPLAAMQVLFGINLDGAVYQKSKDILSDWTTYAIALIAILLVVLPLSALWLFDFGLGLWKKTAARRESPPR